MQIKKISLAVAFTIIAFSNSAHSANLEMDGGRLLLNLNSETSKNAFLWAYPWVTDRVDFGWGADQGANMELYSSSDPTRTGEFKFIYGGALGKGKVVFQHYSPENGWVEETTIDSSGNLYVRGTVRASEVIVQSSFTWPDYVFGSDYTLMPIQDLSSFIEKNGHLPDVPTQENVKSGGVDLGAVSATLLRKVEELTLYVIDLQKQNNELEKEISKIKSQ